MPTGDEDDWLGAGAWGFNGGALWSGSVGRFAPRANAGYTFSREREDGFDVPDEINYGFGTDVALSRFVSASVDAVGRVIRDVREFQSGTLVLPGATGAPGFTSEGVLLEPTGTTEMQALFGSAGVRVLVARHLLLSGDYIFPILDGGLAPKMGVVVGANFVF